MPFEICLISHLEFGPSLFQLGPSRICSPLLNNSSAGLFFGLHSLGFLRLCTKMADNRAEGENFASELDAPLRNRKRNSKAFKTLGVDTSAEKQRKMLGLDDEAYHKALREAADSIDEPLAGGHSIEIPDEQIEAQLEARRGRGRSSSCAPSSSHSRRHQYGDQAASSSSDNVTNDVNELVDARDSDSVPSQDNGSDNEPFSDGAARVGRQGARSRDLDEESQDANWDRKRWRSPSARGLIDADHEDGPVSTSAPNRYFYYYYDGDRKQPRRRRASFGESTPMMDKRANRKALTILGINPSEEKVMDLLGINEPDELQTAVADSLSAPESPTQELPPGRPVQPKALSTLGLPRQPTKADVLLGRFDSSADPILIDRMVSFHLDTPFL